MSAHKRTNLPWRSIFLESLFVVMGVVLALAANEWREQRNRNQHVETALESIRSELLINGKGVENALRYHMHLDDTLRAYAVHTSGSGDSGDLYPESQIFTQGYIAPAPLLHTAWEAANATEAVNDMDYEDVLMLSRIYEKQRRYEYQAQQGGQLVYERLFSAGHEGMRRNYRNLGSMISAFWYRECELLDSYNRVLEQLGEAAISPGGTLPARCLQVLPGD